jgi:REP element-mobilizing transposase RayT
MVVLDETLAYRRYLPHLARRGQTYFVTFCTYRREVLAPADRTIALETCVREHNKSYWLHCACVMPDHLHLIFTPFEFTSMRREVERIKRVSAHQINRGRQRTGHVWQREYFDRIMRSDEDIRLKSEYVCLNPVRAGLVECAEDYPWIWREWVEGRR